MRKSRSDHVSCAQGSTVFIYGGKDEFAQVKTFERITLDSELEEGGTSQSLPNQKQWKSFSLAISYRGSPLFSAVSQNQILLLGGVSFSLQGFVPVSDGVLIDTDANAVASKLTASETCFSCYQNQHCRTEFGDLICIGRVTEADESYSAKLIEIKAGEFTTTAFQDC